MFKRIKEFFTRKRVETPPVSVDVEMAGDDLDCALHTYAELLDSGCRDTLVLDAARERIADLRERYQQLKLEHMNHWTT